MTNAHEADITALDFSYGLSLIASGAADGKVKLWDYQSLIHLGELAGHEGSYITGLVFPTPCLLPLLASADSSGTVMVW